MTNSVPTRRYSYLPQRGRSRRPRQPRLQRKGPAQVRRQGRPRRADLGNRDARETAAAFRSDLADREEAVMAPDAGTARKPSPSRGGLGGDGFPSSPGKTHPHPGLPLEGEGDKLGDRKSTSLNYSH